MKKDEWVFEKKKKKKDKKRREEGEKRTSVSVFVCLCRESDRGCYPRCQNQTPPRMKFSCQDISMLLLGSGGSIIRASIHPSFCTHPSTHLGTSPGPRQCKYTLSVFSFPFHSIFHNLIKVEKMKTTQQTPTQPKPSPSKRQR